MSMMCMVHPGCMDSVFTYASTHILHVFLTLAKYADPYKEANVCKVFTERTIQKGSGCTKTCFDHINNMLCISVMECIAGPTGQWSSYS